MNQNSKPDEQGRRRNRQRNNPAYQLRIDGYRWNLSQMAKALNFDRATIRSKLKSAGIKPAGRVHGTDVYELAEAIPPLFGCPPKSPKQ